MAVDVESLYRTYGPMVHRRCRAMLRDEQRAQDAMQDVFVQVVRHQERLTETAPSSLLYQIATRTCLNIIRQKKRHPEDDETLLETIAYHQDPTDWLFAKGLLERAFQSTKPGTRTLAVMHLVDGMTLEETASAAGMSVSGVRKRLRGLKAKLAATGVEV